MLEWQDLLAAFSLYLVLEGVIPFFNPGAFKRFLQGMGELPDSTLRYIGLGSMILGVLLLNFVR